MVLFANERRVAHDVVELAGWHELGPINLQGIAFADVGTLDQRYAGNDLTKLHPCQHVHLVVSEPHGNLCNLCRELLDFDAIELVHVHLQETEHTADTLAELAGRPQDFQFELSQLAVGNHQKITTAASGVQERQRLQLLVELEQLVLAALDLFELRMQFVKAQRPEQFEDVGFTGVVRPKLAASVCGIQLDHGLEHGTEDRRGNRAPVHRTQRQKLLPHGTVKLRRPVMGLEQFAVHKGKL